jgi:hypothetical protein
MLSKWFKKRQANKAAEELRARLEVQQVLLDSMRKSVDTKVFHKELVQKPGVRNSPVVPSTVSYDYYQTMKRMGASQKLLDSLKPIVKDWPDENPGEFIFRS